MTISVLDEISDWKLEASLEDSERYYFNTRITDLIVDGRRSFVIGRKGSGKTAIGEHVSTLRSADFFHEKLSFRNFPFSILYAMRDDSFSPQNQYINAWMYLIYATICKMLSENAKVDLETRGELKKAFGREISKILPGNSRGESKFKFGIKILDSGFNIEREPGSIEPEGLDLASKVDAIEKYIFGKLGAATYVITFDDLDDDYHAETSDIKKLDQRRLLVGLFKAVQSIKSRFKEHKVYPVVFLRDDIYALLTDSEKNKWRDYTYHLDWDETAIKKLLAFRISRAISATGELLSFQDAWRRIYSGNEGIGYGRNQAKSMDVFDYISTRTLDRPRDYIRYLQICAEKAISLSKSSFDATVMRSCARDYSFYFRDEFVDEVGAEFPKIKQLFQLFSSLNAPQLDASKFRKEYEVSASQGFVPRCDPNTVLKLLFRFSIIGTSPNLGSKPTFRYQDPNEEIFLGGRIYVHKGLHTALGMS